MTTLRVLVMRLLLASIACSAVMGAACVRSAPPTPTTARAAVDRLIDSAGAAGLATAPLRSVVREGVAKGAPDSLILRAVQAQVREEAQARKP